jgi:hypothetical protein
VAKDQQTLERWQADPLANLKEGFKVQPLPVTLLPLVEKAVAQWEEREKQVLSALQMDREQFLIKFRQARESFLQGNDEWKSFIFSTDPIVHDTVRNLDWVSLFTWKLPTADPENKDRYRTVGLMVASIFYIYSIVREEECPGAHFNPMGKIEAYWKLVNQTD